MKKLAQQIRGAALPCVLVSDTEEAESRAAPSADASRDLDVVVIDAAWLDHESAADHEAHLLRQTRRELGGHITRARPAALVLLASMAADLRLYATSSWRARKRWR